MPTFVKAVIVSGVSSILAAMTLTIGFARVRHINPGIDISRFGSMRYDDAMAYVMAHSTQPSAWDMLAVPAVWMNISKIAACMFVFLFASTMATILWSRRTYSV